MEKKKNAYRQAATLYIAASGLIAAMYVALTLPFAQVAFGPIQFRLAEVLTVLPIFMPAAIPGLTIGCFLANLLNPMNLGVIDIVFGPLATLLAALLTRMIAQKTKNVKRLASDILALIPPVVVNAIIVGGYLSFLLTDGPVTPGLTALFMTQVGLSEIVPVYLLGLPFLFFLRKAGIENKVKDIRS